MTIDLSIFKYGIESEQAIATSDSNGSVVDGKRKLVQRFVMELLTEQGSLLYRPDRGTNFLSTIRDGVLNSWEVMAAFSAALLIISRNLVADELSTDPDEERFAAASANQIIISIESVTMNISIINLAGTTENVLLPLIFDLQ